MAYTPAFTSKVPSALFSSSILMPNHHKSPTNNLDPQSVFRWYSISQQRTPNPLTFAVHSSTNHPQHNLHDIYNTYTIPLPFKSQLPNLTRQRDAYTHKKADEATQLSEVTAPGSVIKGSRMEAYPRTFPFVHETEELLTT